MVFATGHDMRNELLFGDGLGKLYVGIAAAWTGMLLCATIFLVYSRNIPFLRVRNIPLSVSAVAILHVYWILCLIAYGFNGFYPCATEYWIMNIYLPFGIALFHASNSQMFYVAGLQRQYACTESHISKGEKSGQQGWSRFRSVNKSQNSVNKTMNIIAVGMIIQLVIALFIFFMSKRFHHEFGVFGERMTNDAAGRASCRRGYEWIPSILWQFFWAWIYAPYLLWKVRGIRDVNGWRTQTIFCCLVGLPASPMWLIALYLPQMQHLDLYVVPPLWFVPSIALMEIFMIFVPCWQILKHEKLKQETLDIIAEWENQKFGSSVNLSLVQSVTSSRISNERSTTSSASSRRAQSHLYTMTALEKALQTNSTPLLLFAALKDFSGENIAFLKNVREWKQGWHAGFRWSSTATSPSIPFVIDSKLRRSQFSRAVDIYTSFVSLKFSRFPINISSPQLKELRDVFEEAASLVASGTVTSSNAATPFNDWNPLAGLDDIEQGFAKDEISTLCSTLRDNSSVDEILTCTSRDQDRKRKGVNQTIINTFKMEELGDKLPRLVSIPPAFSPAIFDNSFESIKYTVLTNTWPKFVNEGYAAKIERQTSVSSLKDMQGKLCGFMK